MPVILRSFRVETQSMARIGVGNQVMSGEDFARGLQEPPAAGQCVVNGFAKRADSEQEILFSRDLRGGSWTTIPASMIESVEVLGRAQAGDDPTHRVRLTLRTPPGPESTVLARLLDGSDAVTSPGTGEVLLPNDGVLPLRVVFLSTGPLLLPNDGVLPLRVLGAGNGGTVPLIFTVPQNGGTLPLILNADLLQRLLNGISGTLDGTSPGGS